MCAKPGTVAPGRIFVTDFMQWHALEAEECDTMEVIIVTVNFYSKNSDIYYRKNYVISISQNTIKLLIILFSRWVILANHLTLLWSSFLIYSDCFIERLLDLNRQCMWKCFVNSEVVYKCSLL